MAWTVPKIYVVGELITAGILNVQIRDNLKYLKGLAGAITFSDDIITAFNVDGVNISGHEARHISGGADDIDSPINIAAMANLANGKYWRGDATNRPIEL